METSNPSKKRKIRKGTQSCWQCKRRKTRCTFADPDEPVCDGCRSRQVKCISQEFYNEADTTITRVGSERGPGTSTEQLTGSVRARSSDFSSRGQQQMRTTASRETGDSNQDTDVSQKSPLQASQATTDLSTRTKHGHDELCQSLLSAWPSRQVLDAIMNVDVEPSVLVHGIVCMPYTKFLDANLPSLQEALRLSPSVSHPVLIARKLLLLGLLLQGISPAEVKTLSTLGVNCHGTMSCVIDTANRLVTSNDSLVDSLEGIECIMIESMYQNNAGNLRGAWLTNRRAMTIAQMMRLHAGGEASSRPNTIDVKTRERIDPEYMWLRLVTSDRYLSLMLGLPQGCQGNPFATPQALQSCEPIERMERLETVVGGLLIQRTRKDLYDHGMTHSIDQLLQDAAASMPADWWLIPESESVADSKADTFRETIRITNQFAHYHTLAQLHLPYLLCSSTDRKYDYSRITTVSASREILLRYLWFHRTHIGTAYCRGIDFLAFIASTILCVAHAEKHRQSQTRTSSSINTLQFLAPLRLNDRGLIERTLKVMEGMVQNNNDVVARRIADILQRLLVVETAAAEGRCYSSTVSPHSHEQIFTSGDDDADKNRDNVLKIGVPHLGTITIERGGGTRNEMEPYMPESGNSSSDTRMLAPRSHAEYSSELNPSLDTTKQQLQGDRSLSMTDSNYGPVDAQPLPNGFLPTPTISTFAPPFEDFRTGASDRDLGTFSNDFSGIEDLLAPAEDEDWILQGVDMNLFDNLFEWQWSDR